jgi:hypothetical protein
VADHVNHWSIAPSLTLIKYCITLYAGVRASPLLRSGSTVERTSVKEGLFGLTLFMKRSATKVIAPLAPIWKLVATPSQEYYTIYSVIGSER